MSVFSSSNSPSRPMTTSLASLIRFANSSGGMSMRPASESALQTRSFSDFSCGSITALYSIADGLGLQPRFVSSLGIRRLNSSLLEPEIRVRQILVQFGPERLLLISGIQPGFDH